jgi:hypothetical protein
MVNRTHVLMALAAVGLASAATSSAQTRDPRIGHWAQQPGPGSNGLHVTYEDRGEGRFRLTLGAHNAPANRRVVEGKCDGGTYPFVTGDGTATGTTLSCRITGPLTMEYLYTQADKTVWATSTGVETVSADGSTLAWDAVHRDRNGGIVEELHSRFSRRDDETLGN